MPLFWWIILVSTLFMSAGYVGIAFIDSLWEFYICYGLLAAIGFGGASIPLVAALMSNWFEKRRGLAISLAISGNCIGQFLLVPVFTNIVTSYGWRISYGLIGFIMLVVNTLLGLAVIRGNPADLGLQPYGRHEREVPRKVVIQPSLASQPLSSSQSASQGPPTMSTVTSVGVSMDPSPGSHVVTK